MIGLGLILGVRGFDVDRMAGTIQEYSGWIIPWRRTVHRTRDFRGIAIRAEPGGMSSTAYALYLVGRDREDLRIDAWDRWETEIEASRLAQFLGMKVIES